MKLDHRMARINGFLDFVTPSSHNIRIDLKKAVDYFYFIKIM